MPVKSLVEAVCRTGYGLCRGWMPFGLGSLGFTWASNLRVLAAASLIGWRCAWSISRVRAITSDEARLASSSRPGRARVPRPPAAALKEWQAGRRHAEAARPYSRPPGRLPGRREKVQTIIDQVP